MPPAGGCGNRGAPRLLPNAMPSSISPDGFNVTYPAAGFELWQVVEKLVFHVILNKVKDLNRLRIRDSSLYMKIPCCDDDSGAARDGRPTKYCLWWGGAPGRPPLC